MSKQYYGKVGTTSLIVVDDTQIHPSHLEGYVKMVTVQPPDLESTYVIDETGNWELSRDDEHIKSLREESILAKWPLGKQLEAILDYIEGDATKIQQLRQHLKHVKALKPYNKQSPKIPSPHLNNIPVLKDTPVEQKKEIVEAPPIPKLEKVAPTKKSSRKRK